MVLLILIHTLKKNKNIELYTNYLKNFKILYIIRSIPKYYDDRLKSQYNTWMQLLTKQDDILVASDNYKHKDSDAYQRYERYKKATNYNEFIELGGNNKDYYNDFRKEYLKILD